MNCFDSCPLCIRRVCHVVCKFLGFKRHKGEKGAEYFVDESETGRIRDIESDARGNASHRTLIQHTAPPVPPPQPPKQKQEIKVTEEQFFGNIEKDVFLEPTIESKPQPPTQDLLSSDPVVPIKPPSPVYEPIEIPPLIVETSSFRINLEPTDKYYELLTQKTQKLRQKFNQATTPITDLELSSVSTANLQIRHAQPGELNIFIYTYRLPCTYSFYNSMMNDYQIQKKLDSNIDEFKMLELVSNNARVNYLSYKRMLIVSPRDFVYLKYSNSWERECWDVSFSVPTDPTPSKVRAEIILSAVKVVEQPSYIEVQVYSEVDMKLRVNPKIMKNQAVNEIRKYVQRCQEYVRNNYQREII